nr:uncharacterized protein LOC114823884 [Malus domestica]
MGFQQRKGPMASMGCIRVRVLTWDQIAINEVLALVHIKGMALIKVKALLWVQQTTIREAMDSLGTIKDLSILRIIVGHSIQIGTLNHTLVTNTRAIVAFLLIRARDHNLVLVVSLQIVVLKMDLLGRVGMAIQILDPLLHLNARFAFE